MISVLLPYRDARSTIVRAIESVLVEACVDEVIAIDDGSRDGGFSVLENMHNARIVHVRTDGMGVAGALRVGLSHARGDLIARMDADDVNLAGRIEAEVALLQNDSRVAVSGCQVMPFVDEGEGPRGMLSYVAWQNNVVTIEDHARAIFIESPLCHPSTTMRRDALEAVGGFRDARWAEDWDLWMRMNQAGYGLAKVPRVLFRWRQDPQSVTRRDVRCSVERMREGRAHYLAMRLRAMARPIDVWGAGPTGKRLARALEAHGLHAARFVDVDPKKIGHVRRGVPVIASDELTRDHAIVIAVAARGARELIVADLVRRGFVEGEHFVSAA